MASAKYLKYLSDLNKTDNHDDDNLSKIYYYSFCINVSQET